MEREF